MEKQVKYLGYIDKKEITALYKASMLFPCLLIWSNKYTPLTFKNSVPVLYPYSIVKINFFNNGIWPIDLKDPKTLSLQIEKILKNDGAKDEKIEFGKSF